MAVCSTPCLEYVWPPVLTAGRNGVLNVCAFTEQAGSTVSLQLASSACLLLENAAQLHAGHNTFRLEVAPRPAGAILSLTMGTDARAVLRRSDTVRRPGSVPLLVLPEESVQEVNNLFDSMVRTRLALVRNAAANPAAPAQTDRISTHNLVVGQVFRETVMPLLQDMQVILADAPYHVIRGACSRLAPVLHGASMRCCLSVLRELVRTHNDIREDLFDLSLPVTGGPPPANWMTQDAGLLMAQAVETAATVPAQPGGSEHASSHTQPSSLSSACQQPLHATGSHATRSSGQAWTARSSGLHSSIYYSMPDCAEPCTTPLYMLDSWDKYMLSVDDFLAPGECTLPARTLLPMVPPPANTNAAHPRMPPAPRLPQNGLAAGFPMHAPADMMTEGEPPAGLFAPPCAYVDEDMPDTDEELDLLFSGGETDAEENSNSNFMVLTSFLPDQEVHMEGNPLQMLHDPDEPRSRALSDVGTVIDSIVQASHEQQEGTGQQRPMVRVPSERSFATDLSGLLPDSQDPLPGPEDLSGMQADMGMNGGVEQPHRDLDGNEHMPGELKHTVAVPEKPQGLPCLLEVPSDEGSKVQSSVDSNILPPTTSGPISPASPASHAPTSTTFSIRQALRESFCGFADGQQERRFRRFWSRRMRLMDAVTLCLTLLLMFSTLQHVPPPAPVVPHPLPTAVPITSANQHADMVNPLAHGATLVLVALLAAPLLVGTYLVVVHHKATLKHREAITAATRLLNSCLWVVVLGVGLHTHVDLLRALLASRTSRFAIGQFKNACRPLLLRHVMVCAMLEALCLAAMAHHSSTLAWALEVASIWATSCVTTACVDIICRQAYLAHRAANTTSQPGSHPAPALYCSATVPRSSLDSSSGHSTAATTTSGSGRCHSHGAYLSS